MSSPRALQLKLQHEIKKRINQNSPSKNDLQYYQRKIRRLQNQQSISQDQISKLRVKLKRAEDFQFKYQLQFKQMSDLRNQTESLHKQNNLLQTLNQQLKENLQQKSANAQDFSIQRANLLEQSAKWKDKFDQLQHRSKIQLQDERIRCQQTIKRQINRVKAQQKQREEDYVYEIHQLKKSIHQKETVQHIINQRVQKIRTEKDEEISRLNSILKQRKESYEAYMHQKVQQLEKMKNKFEKMINFDIENLKNNQQDQEEIFSIELNGLRQMIGLKNDENIKLLNQINRQTHDHEINRRELLEQITILKQKIYTVQRQSQIELQNLKLRLITVHAQDIKALEDRHQRIVETLNTEMHQGKKFIKELERINQNQAAEMERVKHDFHDRLKQKDKRISDIGENLQQRGQLNASQLKSLHQSFHKINSQKEDLTSQYQSNVTFLNQQLAKQNSIIEIKTQQITKLHQELHNLKISYQERLVECQSKYRRQRKQRQQQREQQRIQRDKQNQKLSDMQRQWKNQQRRLQREKQRLQRQKNKLQYMLQQSERDIQRLNRYIKQLDQSLKQEFKKNQLSTLDKDGLRREVLSELQRQKVELQAMKMMQTDQLRKKYQVQNARLTTANQQMKTDILNKSIAFQNLESQFKKLDYKHRNADKLQKDKIKQYEQKMITLNHEIGVTQNLYQAFLEAKARAGK